MGDIVDLKPAPIEDDELVENLARYADGTLTEGQVKARHHLTEAGRTGRERQARRACRGWRTHKAATCAARQAGSRKYEFSPINPQPGLSCVGEAAAVEPALVGSIGKERRIRGHLAADAGVDFAP